jgi:hypothetical protein
MRRFQGGGESVGPSIEKLWSVIVQGSGGAVVAMVGAKMEVGILLDV